MKDILVGQFLVNLRLFEGFLLLLLGHALELDLFGHEGLLGSFVNYQVDAAVVPAADQLFL